MSDNRLTRQQIYDRIRETSKEEYILEEMKRLGFWKVSDGIPKLSETLITRKGELRRELNQLVEKQRKYQDKEQLLKDMRKKRMKEALERRALTKEKHQKLKAEKAARWQETKTHDIIFLGKSYSSELNNKENDTAKLKAAGLPVLATAEELAQAMGLSIGALRFLSFGRKTSKTTHYKRFFLKKKSGGKRLISAPMPRLKNAQYWILEHILYQLKVNTHAHGFVPERSIITNASLHCGKDVVINMDMKDFFPTVSYKRVKGLFQSFGYSPQISTILALLTTESNVDEVDMDGQRYYVASGERFLPQGAPTSPAITNLICRKMDRRFEGMVQQLGWTYSRYADDLSFSSNTEKDINRVLWQAKQIIEDEGFVLHPQKVKVMRKGRQQEVTGLVVNEKVNIPRKKLKQFRALLHKIEHQGIDGLSWGEGFILFSIQGFANYVKMVNPNKGEGFVQKVKAILAKPEHQAAIKSYLQHREEVVKTPKTEQQEQVVTQESGTTSLDKAIQPVAKKEVKEDWWRLW